MSLAEKGAYIDCLAHQWGSDEGVPGDDPVALGRIIRATPSDARRVWSVIGRKFEKSDDGSYRNARVERERATKARYYASKSENGSKGGRPVKTETKAIGLAPSPSPSPSPSVPNGTASAGAERKRHGDPFGMRLDPNAAAHIFAGNEQIVSVPQGWASKAMREYGLSLPDLTAFAAWASGVVQREGFEDGGKRLAWLDGLLARWRVARSAPVDRALRPASEWIAEQDRIAAEIAAADAAYTGPRLTVAEMVAESKKRRAVHG